jgi:hypothetical protein
MIRRPLAKRHREDMRAAALNQRRHAAAAPSTTAMTVCRATAASDSRTQTLSNRPRSAETSLSTASGSSPAQRRARCCRFETSCEAMRHPGAPPIAGRPMTNDKGAAPVQRTMRESEIFRDPPGSGNYSRDPPTKKVGRSFERGRRTTTGILLSPQILRLIVEA